MVVNWVTMAPAVVTWVWTSTRNARVAVRASLIWSRAGSMSSRRALSSSLRAEVPLSRRGSRTARTWGSTSSTRRMSMRAGMISRSLLPFLKRMPLRSLRSPSYPMVGTETSAV
ncbi:MAG: hypothetical protein AAGC74_01755 [Verrucomicrobiota bacterium]